MSAATFTATLSFGTYRTIVLDPQQPSFKKMAASVFHSTNLKLDSRWKQTAFSGRCWQKIVPGLAVLVAIKPGPSTTSFEKNYFLCFVPQFQSRCMKSATLLTVGSHVHWDTKFWYLSYDSFRSSTTFIRRDGRFRVSFNKLDSRWKQTVFSGRWWQIIVPGLAVPVATKPGSSKTPFEKMYFLCFVPHIESRCMKTVTLLFVGSHVHWDTKFWYLS